MADSDRLAPNSVLPVEQVGDLLVVTPVGDPVGFSASIFRKEMSRVKQLAAKPSVRNVLVDFSKADYFGSAMIGSLVELRRAVAASHGQLIADDESMTSDPADGGMTAICGLSDDMSKGLEILSVDQVLLTYPSRKKAVRALATQSFSSRLAGGKLSTRVLTPVMLAAAAYLLMFTPMASAVFNGTATGDFDTVTRAYARWDLRAKTAMNPEEIAKAAQPMLLELRELRVRVREQKPASEARIYVAVAAGRLTELVNSPNDKDREASFHQMMTIARQKIYEDSGVVAPVPDCLAGFVPRPKQDATRAKALSKVDTNGSESTPG